MKQSFEANKNDAREVGNPITMISQAIAEENLAINDGLTSMEAVYSVCSNPHRGFFPF